MKVFFSLIVFSLVLAACQACYDVMLRDEIIDGKVVKASTCVDVYDGKKHLLGSSWTAADCYWCECHKDGMGCCHRDVKEIPGCKLVINQVTCEYEFYRLDDPTQRCDA